MAVSVVMPALEMAQETGKLVSWLKNEGEQVKKGEMLLEVETDKAVVEIEAQTDGVLGGITAKVGDVVPVGQTIAWLLKPGESVPQQAAPTQTGRTGAAVAPVAGPSSASAGPTPAEPASAAGARISPKARKLAREHGVDIATIKGSGPGGEILADDILKAASGAAAPIAPVAPTSVSTLAPTSVSTLALTSVSTLAPTSVSTIAPTSDSTIAPTSDSTIAPTSDSTIAPTSDSTIAPLAPTEREVAPLAPTGASAVAPDSVSSIGRIMAERTTQSWTTVPHFFVSRDVDATTLNATRKSLVPVIEKSHGVKVTHTDLLVAAVARALRLHPRMNASWSNGSITLNRDVNVALAMAVENAVVTAVIRGADTASLGDIAKQRNQLAERARANRLQPADITGATFTISNLGMFSVDAFTAIIVPPQAGILAVGAITDRVVAVDGMIGVRAMMNLTLSSDHRLIDGARAAQFLNDVVTGLQAAEKLGD